MSHFLGSVKCAIYQTVWSIFGVVSVAWSKHCGSITQGIKILVLYNFYTPDSLVPHVENHPLVRADLQPRVVTRVESPNLTHRPWASPHDSEWRAICIADCVGCWLQQAYYPGNLFQYRNTGTHGSVKAPPNDSPRSISLAKSMYLGKGIVDYPEMMSYRFRTHSNFTLASEYKSTCRVSNLGRRLPHLIFPLDAGSYQQSLVWQFVTAW
jgi:hypothetical protein